MKACKSREEGIDYFLNTLKTKIMSFDNASIITSAKDFDDNRLGKVTKLKIKIEMSNNKE